MSGRSHAMGNVYRYYLYSGFWYTGFWVGVWVKYLTVVRGFDLRWIFLMDLPYWLLTAALETPFGVVGDRIGRKKMMVVGQALYACTILGMGFVESYPMLLADYLLWAVASAMISGADQALVYDSLKEEGLEDRFSRIAGRAYATSIGAAFLSVFSAGFLAEGTSLTFTIRISAVFPALAALVALTMREGPRAPPDRGYFGDLREGFAFSWRTPQVRWGIALGSVVMSAAFAPFILTQPFLLDHDVATRYFGVFQAPLRLGAVVAALLAARVVAARGPAPVFLGCIVGLVLSFAGLGVFDTTPAFALFLIPSVVQGLVRPAMDTYLNERAPSERRATILSVWSLSLALQLGFFEPALGFVADWTSAAGAAVFAAAWFSLMLPPLYLAWARAARGGPTVYSPREGGSDAPPTA